MSLKEQEAQPTGYSVGDLTIDLTHRQLRRQGRLLPCGKLTFELLVLLASEAPRVVGHEAMAERIWGGRYVSPGTVKRRVSMLRETLGESAGSPGYIRVVRGHGYALMPEVRPWRASRARWPAWVRSSAVAGALAIMFLFGAEIGYQDGLAPAIPDLQGSASIYITSLPRELPQEEYSFVMETAQRFLNAINRTDFLGGLGRAGKEVELIDRDSLTVMANVVDNDFDSIYVTLALLRDSRPDYRETRVDELSSFARTLQDVRPRGTGAVDLARSFGRDEAPARRAKYEVHVFVPAQIRGENFLLVASLRFDRAAIRSQAPSIQSEAAVSMASAIEEQLARLDSGKWEKGP